jgi:cystathionine gamma-lyase
MPDLRQGQPIAPGPVFASMFRLAGEPASSPYAYGRYHNPTWSDWESALSELEGGPSVAFPSGMAAITAMFATMFRPGDTIVLPEDGYYAARSLARGWFRERGLNVRTTPTAGEPEGGILDGARMLWIESPSNPGLEICDIRRLCELAHSRNVLVAVDNTTPTVLGQKPLELGADFSVSSDTKALTGHSDVVLGHIAARDTAHADALRGWRTQTGSIPGPMEVWLAHRSLSTLALRLARMSENALAVARFLSAREGVTGVRYPGLESHPGHDIAARQMSYYGPVVSFEVEDAGAADRFIEACRLVIPATSFGSVHTTAERRARWGGDAISDGFIRMSVGCEHIDDLIADLSQGLDA